MTENLDDLCRDWPPAGAQDGEQMDRLVTRALDVLAARRLSGSSRLVSRFLEALKDAVLDEDRGRRRVVLGAMRDARIPMHEIVDHYIPEVARSLGEDWLDNRRSFADVTIGTSRLQGLLREISQSEPCDPIRGATAPAIAVIVPENETHTLGALVLAQQLRRLGASVQLMIGLGAAEVVRGMAQDHFDAALISLSRAEALASSKKLVEKIRSATILPTPVVVGGAVVDEIEKTKAVTGADYVAHDARDALLKCGLKTSLQGAENSAVSS